MEIVRDLEKMSADDLLTHLNGLGRSPETGALETVKAALQVRIADQIFNTVQEARKDLINASGDLRKSIDSFRKSNEKTSNRLVYLSVAIAAAALVQAIYVVKLFLNG